MQVHFASRDAASSPLDVNFSTTAARAEWIALRGSKDAAADRLLRVSTATDVMVVGPATPWAADDAPALSLEGLTVCATDAAGRDSPAPRVNATVRVHFLPAGARVYSHGAVGSALATRTAGRAGPLSPALDTSPGAMGLGAELSYEHSVSVSVPQDCLGHDLVVRLSGAAGYTGTLLQLGIVVVPGSVPGDRVTATAVSLAGLKALL
jgi:hypothetical protein